MSIKYAMLGLLANGPLHGYELKNAYDGELVPDGQVNYGQIYTCLDRLGKAGLLRSSVVRQSVRPDKKVYELTDDGRRELDAWFRTPTRFDLDLRNETFLKLMLSRQLDAVDPLEVIAVERRSCLERLHRIVEAKTDAEAESDRFQTMLTLDLASLRLEAFIKWLDHCEEVLGQEKP